MIVSYLQKKDAFETTTPCYLCSIITQLTRNDSYKQKLIAEDCTAAVKRFIQNNLRSTILCVYGCSALDGLTKKSGSKKGNFAGNTGIGFIFSLLKTYKYDKETYAAVLSSLGFIVSMDREKALFVANACNMQLVVKILMRFVDTLGIASEFTTLVYNTIKSLIDLESLKLFADNVDTVYGLLFQIAKKMPGSADIMAKSSFVLYTFITNFSQSK